MSTQVERRGQLSDPVERYRRMLEIRLVEDSIQALYNDGHVRGSTHLSSGQEAVSVGVAAATRPTDTFTCTYRGHGAALALGVTPEGVLGELCGRVIGCAGGLGGSMHLGGPDVGLFPTFAIVGAGLPIAVGAGLSAQTLGTDSIGVAIFGDGSTNIGAFHESLNLAAIWKLPVVFVIENNLYGEYSRIQLTTPVEDLADRAASYAMPSEIVDGQDVEAVIASMSRAVARARSGEGPTLLEMKTYRYSGHSRSDPAIYRPDGELDQWLARDPLTITAQHLVEQGLASEVELESIGETVRASVVAAVAAALASEAPAEREMFEHVHASE